MLSTDFWKKYFRDYDTLQELGAYRELMQSLYSALQHNQEDTILDLGAGTGNLQVLFSEIKPAQMVCFDMSEEGLARCTQKAPWATTVKGDLEETLPFADASFSIIVSNNALYTIARRERESIYREIARVLKPEGRMVIANILEHFSPFAIYMHEIKRKMRLEGIAKTAYDAIRLLPPTMRIMYYNARIKKAHSTGEYNLFSKGEQSRELEKVGLSIVHAQNAYADQSELVVAIKK